MKLHKANFCRVRLCPICQWRRSLKTFAQMNKVISVAEKDYSFIHLVLTVPNCSGDNLSKTLDKMFKAFSNKFAKYARFKKAVKGYYRGMEVTHNLEADTYHPHFHCLLAVNKSYFTSRDYIKRAEWLELWRKAMGDKTITQVHVSKIKNGTAKAIAEVAKYTCKPSDIICYDDWDLTVDTVKVLDKSLNKRRFIGLGGVLRDIHKALNLDDIEDGDLTHIEADESELSNDEKNIISFYWHTGYNQYVKGKKEC